MYNRKEFDKRKEDSRTKKVDRTKVPYKRYKFDYTKRTDEVLDSVTEQGMENE